MAVGTFRRVTVSAPHTTVDVALPPDVPVAELVPMLLQLVGEPRGATVVPWRLYPVGLGPAGSSPLPAAACLAELPVPDGAALRLAPEHRPPLPPVFDDPADAIAASAGTGRTRPRGIGAAAVLAAVAVAAGLLVESASAIAAALAGAGAAAALALAQWQTRAGRRRAALVAGLAAIPLAAVAAWDVLADGGVPTGVALPSALLLTAAAAGIAAAAAQLVVRSVAPILIGTVVVAVFGCVVIGAVRFGVALSGAAAVVGATAVVTAPLLGRAALRLAGVPRPAIPDADPGHDPGLPPTREIVERGVLARAQFSGLTCGFAVSAVLCAVVAAAAGGWIQAGFAAVTVAVVGLRARGYADPAPTTITAAAAGLGALVLVVVAGRGAPPIAAGVLLACAVGAGLGRPLASPVLLRVVDQVAAVLAAVVVPLAFWAAGLFGFVRGF